MTENERKEAANCLKLIRKQYNRYAITHAIDLAVELLQMPQWNSIKYRPMTEEEVLETEEKWGIELTIDERVCFDCSMPEDNQEILVCTKWGRIYIDRCELEIDSGYGLETNGDWDGIIAWMPLPEPYKAESEEL